LRKDQVNRAGGGGKIGFKKTDENARGRLGREEFEYVSGTDQRFCQPEIGFKKG